LLFEEDEPLLEVDGVEDEEPKSELLWELDADEVEEGDE
jgi:hypothetical protein